MNELEQRARTEYVSPGARGLIWIELGEADRGYALVETACAERDARIRELKANAVYADLRGDPRFHRILKCMNLE
jgi:hypothetical protein